MVTLRYALIVVSALYAAGLLLMWIVSGGPAGIGTFVPLVLVLANLFYVVMSRPSIRTSEFLVRTSDTFASASIELRYRAQEAQAKEVEAEKRRLADAEHHHHKLQAAKEMLQHFRPKPTRAQTGEATPQLIAYQAESAKAGPSARPAPAADRARPANGHALTPDPVSPVSPAPPATPPKPVPAVATT